MDYPQGPSRRLQQPSHQQQADASSSSDSVETPQPTSRPPATSTHLPMHSESLFRRERAQSIPKASSAKPTTLQHSQSQPALLRAAPPVQQSFDALDRFNARRGVQKPSRAHDAWQQQQASPQHAQHATSQGFAQQAQQAQQAVLLQRSNHAKPFDALDRFNARRAQQLPTLPQSSSKAQHAQLTGHRPLKDQAAVKRPAVMSALPDADESEQSQTTALQQEQLLAATHSAQAVVLRPAARRLPDALDRFNAARQASHHLRPASGAPAPASAGLHQMGAMGDAAQAPPVLAEAEASYGRMYSDNMVQARQKRVSGSSTSGLGRMTSDAAPSVQARSALAVGAESRAVLANALPTAQGDHLGQGRFRSDARVQSSGQGRAGPSMQHVSADVDSRTRKRMYSDAEAETVNSDSLTKRLRLHRAPELHVTSLRRAEASSSVFGRLG